MKVLLAHPGTQHSHHLAQSLHHRDALLGYCTTFALGSGSILAKVLPQRWATRRSVSIPASLVRLQPALEVFERLIHSGGSARDMLIKRNRLFQHSISDRLLEEADAIIGFDTSSQILANRAESLMRPFYLELTTPHPLEKLEVSQMLRDRYPEWTSGADDVKVIEDEEVAAAFHVSAPGQFVKESYVKRGATPSRITINPYGVFPEQFPLKKFDRRGKIRFLFMGSLTANKGLPMLLKAWREINTDKAELVVAGYGAIPSGVRIPGGVNVVGRIEKSERVALIHSCDVFVCPSFYEGIALVQLESMCCGLPLIGTPASGAADIMTDGREGFVIPTGSVGALTEKMNFFINYPDKIEAMGRESHVRALQLTWQSYADRWLELIARHNTAR